MSEKQQAYISKVHLKGYKSIRDLEIDLLPGLNIIIGPNGSGKTNFLELIQHMNEKWIYEEDQFDLYIQYKQRTDIIEETYKAVYDEIQDKLKHKISFTHNHNLIRKEEYIYKSQIFSKFDKNIIFDKDSNEFFEKFNFLTFIIGFKNEISFFLQTGLALKVRKTEKGISLATTKLYSSFPQGIDTVVFNMFEKYAFKEDKVLISNELVKNISNFTPIKDIKIDTDKIQKGEDESKRTLLSNINLQFLVNDKWLNWRQLSDGTKRLFFIGCCLNSDFNIFLIEEPELGIHPDQLYKLMDFLKEQSKEKQIIITTHSPDVLNILQKDELNRIIVTRYDPEKGTQMHKLSPQQIKKGQMYMKKVGHLSDYWVHSNLEEYEVEQED